MAADTGLVIPPIRYGFRSFDRQWIIPDNRLLNRPNPSLWKAHSPKQVYLTAPHDRTPTAGPALTCTALIPDLHHYHGRGGRVYPLWANAAATDSNMPARLLATLAEIFGREIMPEDVMAYIAAVAAHSAYTGRFAADLVQPGLRIPLTADAEIFGEAADVGREVIWLHTFGERFSDPAQGRPRSSPRLPPSAAPRIPAGGAIPTDAEHMPDTISYDAENRRLFVGAGHIENVPPAVWAYQVSGKPVLTHWFSYRRHNRERPIIGDRRPPSPLGDIQPAGWPGEYTTELLNVIHVLGRLIALAPAQAKLLNRICGGPLITADALRAALPVD